VINILFKMQMFVNKKGSPFTNEEKRFITEHYLLFPVKRVAKMIGRSEYGVFSFLRREGLVVPPELVAQRKKDSQIKKGSVPPNKGKKLVDYCSPEAIERMATTQFKKGNLPPNTAGADGEIRIRFDHPRQGGKAYKYIRLSLSKWVLYHRYLWEQVNGAIPPKHVLRFKDGDSLNCVLDNLEVVSYEKNMELNAIHRFPSELKEVIKLNNKLKRKVNEKLNR
jgi:hypothetical protein